jgi:transcriptional regulator with XRE-family HTH domain
MVKKEKFQKLLGAHIAKVRRSKGYSQDRVYLEAGFSRATMSRIENRLVDVQVYTLVRIADTIGVPLAKLVDVDYNS